ncbi:MAG: hypothetical protein IJT16_10420 [Lachnospiraceae bacterium]|nr:hypothetical protein [Lachnospiraceae bacterium]
MNAVIYTKDEKEYISMAGILMEEADLMDVFRDPLDGHGHYDYPYDVIVVALEGAKGMNTVEEWSDRYPDARIIWLTSDADFVKTAFRRHLSDFLVRPFDEAVFRESVREVLNGSPRWKAQRG